MTDQASAYHVPVLSHYAIWYGPNIDVLSAAVPSRDPRGTIKPGADYFRFYDVLELEAEVDGEMVRFYSGPATTRRSIFLGVASLLATIVTTPYVAEEFRSSSTSIW